MNICTKIALSAVLSFSVTSANALLIDDFSDGNVPFPGINATGAGNTATGSQVGSMIGGARDIDLAVNSGAGTSIVTVAGGVLDINNGVTEISDVTVSWSFGATDFTDLGLSTGVFLSLPTPIDNIMDVMFTLNDGSNASVANVSFPDGASGNDFFISFGDFIGLADITALTSASINISSPNAGLDTQITLIETRPVPGTSNDIPEPASIALFGLGFGLMSFARRKA